MPKSGFFFISLLPKHLRTLSIGLIVIFSLMSIQAQFEERSKQRWDKVADLMHTQLNEDRLIIHPHFEQTAFWYYYDKECLKAAFYKPNCPLYPNINAYDLLPENFDDSGKLRHSFAN